MGQAEALSQCGRDMPLYLRGYRPVAVFLGNRGRCVIGDFAEPRGVASFDFVPQRRSFTIGDRRVRGVGAALTSAIVSTVTLLNPAARKSASIAATS